MPAMPRHSHAWVQRAGMAHARLHSLVTTASRVGCSSKLSSWSVLCSASCLLLYALLLRGCSRPPSPCTKHTAGAGTWLGLAGGALPTNDGVARFACCLGAEDDTGTPYSRRSGCSTDPGDVELMERGAGSSSAADFNAYGAAGGGSSVLEGRGGAHGAAGVGSSVLGGQGRGAWSSRVWAGLRGRGKGWGPGDGRGCAAAAACWAVVAPLCLLTFLRLCSSCKGVLALL